MPILAIFTGMGITKDMYENLRKEINWEENNPDGGIFHVAAFDEQGNIHVADVWESVETMNAFVNDHLMPAMQKFNIPAPKVEVFPVHNITTYHSVEKYIV